MFPPLFYKDSQRVSRMPRSQASRDNTYLSRISLVARKVILASSLLTPMVFRSRLIPTPSTSLHNSSDAGNSSRRICKIASQLSSIRRKRASWVSLRYLPSFFSSSIIVSAELPKNARSSSFHAFRSKFSTYTWAFSQSGVIASLIMQFIPCVDVIVSILCYIMFRKEGQLKG